MPTRERRAKQLGIPISELPDGRGKHGRQVRGKDHPRWNDARLLSSQGYVLLRVGKGHLLADPNGYAYEHLVVWMSAGKPAPADDEILHHRNEDKTDNRIRNLELLKRGDHNRLHNEQRERDSFERFKKAAGRLLDGREWDEYPS